MSSRMYFIPSTYSETTSRRSETATTIASVCLETRSAVRCRVPVSSVRIVGSGVSWTLTCAILVAFELNTIAPSIFASSYSVSGEYSSSNLIPPENRNASSSTSPITISPPERAWRMLSIPSRSAVPGATISSALTIRESCRDSSSSLSSSPERCGMKVDFTWS
jgi:hypothetical protein